MKKIIKKYHRLVVCLLLTVGSLVFTATVFRGAFSSIASVASELWQSFLSYIAFLFFLRLPVKSPVTPPQNEIPNILPSEPQELSNNFSEFFSRLFSGENFSLYMAGIEDFLLMFVRILPIAIMGFYLLRKYIKRAFTKHNNRYNKDTKALKGFKKLSGVVYAPTKNYLANLLDYIRQSKFPKIWLAIWLFNFNVFAVILSVISITLFFFITLDFAALYSFFYNAIVLLLPAFRFIPVFLWLLLALWFIDKWRKQIALDRLRHMENKNKGFILERSICTMLVGTMGKGKTTLVTDISLSTEAIFRHKAYEMMLEIDLQFPHFPYIALENELKKEIEAGRVFNLASCADWIEKRAKEFSETQKIWNYDFEKYGLYYDDKKTLVYLFEALKDYTKLYFIYIINSSLIISNYAIRADFQKIDKGNMPLWDLDFFNRDSRNIKCSSRHSHILDFDMVRLGKKVLDNNEFANAFEFGCIAITEIGKERGNQFKSNEIKDTVKQLRDTIRELEKAKADASTHKAELLELTGRATQLTDKFNEALKLIRHKCTVRGFAFARVILDEQRPESLGADARDLCEIVHIREKSETKIAMPFFFIAELVYALIFPKFKGVYQEYRFNRGDNTFLMYSLKKLGAKIHSYYSRIYNRFGYHIRYLAVEDGATGQIVKETPYYLATKKIYSNRFSTDAYGDIFAEGLKKVNVGLDDIPCYETHKATEAELQSQNSYFIEEITKYKN